MNHELFSDILAQIGNEQIRNFTIECLKLADPILETIPTSSSGKYHPPECNTAGGLVKHIRRCCQFAQYFLQAYKLDDIKEIKGDILYSALLLHDIGKKDKYAQFWEYYDHPIVAALLLDKKKDTLPEKIFKTIRTCVLYHMGPFTPKKILKPIESFTFLELATYNCDYMASRKEIILDVKR